MRITNFLLTMGAIAGLAAAQDSMTDAGAGWAPEFKMAGRQVLMHTASGNYFFLQSMGVKAGEDLLIAGSEAGLKRA